MFALVGQGFIETIYMTVISTALAYIIGLPLGLVLARPIRMELSDSLAEQPSGNDYQLLSVPFPS